MKSLKNENNSGNNGKYYSSIFKEHEIDTIFVLFFV